MQRPPLLAVTAGEPAGIGPDLCVELAHRPSPTPLLVIADPGLLQERASLLKLSLSIQPGEPDSPQPHLGDGRLQVLPVALRVPCRPGQTDPRNAAYVLQTLDEAVSGCMTGHFSGMVTGPVHKAVINDAGIAFSGHTEYIAQRCGGNPVMMLVCPGLRVALATTHLPLRQVADAIDAPMLEQVIRILEHDLRRHFGIAMPRILVCGLNPHAGEGGHLGHEELETIAPVVRRLIGEGLALEGPLPADTLFTPDRLQCCDAVLAMYHDQGLPVLKARGFGNAVNITLGLPLIRTSVDHGTALEIAGTGKADIGSLIAAIDAARTMSDAGRR